jgi:hypothetical protein
MKQVDQVNEWISSGGTKSVNHNDAQDNINCLFSGRKRMLFFHPKYEEKIESKAFGWANVDVDGGPGYGSFARGIDVDAIDL